MDESRIFLLMEGVCSTCKAEVVVTSIGGTKRWLQEQGYMESQPDGAELNVWTGFDGMTVGSMEFKCSKCGATEYVEVNKYGDWN